MEVDEEMEEQAEQEELEHGLAQLQFNKPLTWKAGKPIALAELLKRLEALSRELQGYEQDDVERESLFGVAKELANQQLLGHKDRGVKAFTACCVVDIFRLCAPDAPYTAVQMKVGSQKSQLHHKLTRHRKSSRSSSIPSFPH
jgi:sister-chromatid-cohesion protein PDS5